MDEIAYENVRKNPYNHANKVSRISYWWVNKLVSKFLKNRTHVEHIYEAPTECDASDLKSHLAVKWSREIEKCEAVPKRKPRLLSALISAFGQQLICSWICLLFKFCVCAVLQAYFLYLLHEALLRPETVTVIDVVLYRYLLALGMIGTSIVGAVFFHYGCFYAQIQGIRLRVACCSLVHQKTLVLSKAHSSATTIGQLINIISSDVSKFDQISQYIMPPFISPLSLVINATVLVLLIGYSALPALGCFVLLAITNILQGRVFKNIRRKKNIITDRKLKQTNAAISEMTTIKMFSWEKPFSDVIKSIRGQELKLLLRTAILRSINITNYFLCDKMSMFILVVCSIIMGDDMSANTFVAAIIFANLKYELFHLMPLSVEHYAGCLVTISRVQNVLTLKDKEIPAGLSQANTIEPQGIWIENMSATWNQDPGCFSIQGINLRLNEADLCVITGPVGCGKTSLLMTILGEMMITEGSVASNGKLGFVAQEPWLFPATIRQNILFGKPFDQTLYNEVLYSCMLNEDFQELSNGDDTHVGEKGVALSGGQKARINLARALYLNCDVYLFDDPLSAVDAHVKQHIFKHCIQGFTKMKTRLLVTHELKLLSGIKSKIVFLDKGVVTKTLNYQENIKVRQTATIPASPATGRTVALKTVTSDEKKESPKDLAINAALNERRQSNAEKYSVYKLYVNATFGCCLALVFLTLLILSQAAIVSFDICLSIWSNGGRIQGNGTISVANALIRQSLNVTVSDDALAMITFGVILALLILFIMSCSYMFFICCVRAAAHFHNTMLDGVFRSAVSFFVKNPSGQILNRFSRDMEIVDDTLPFSLYTGLMRMLPVVTMIIEVGYSHYVLVFPVAVILAVGCLFSYAFLKTSKPLKQSEASARSPVYSYFNSSLRGSVTIKVHENEELVKKEFDQHQNTHSAMFFFYMALTRWFGLWLEIMFYVIAAIETIIILSMHDESSQGRIGLVVFSIFSVCGGLQFSVRLMTDADNQMISVKRIKEYGELPEEPGYKVVKVPNDLPEMWPDKGEIVFDNLTLFYDKDGREILKSVSFKIRAGEKVGIVGRTGAGKSSIISALFRIGYLKGIILVDGVDISTLPLLYYRKRISIVPQVPVLLSGTIRDNLDPFHEHTDEKLWHALECVELKEHVMQLSGELSAPVAEGATNFSMGQRQLLCLARITLQDNRIVVLDEATSNLDHRNDDIVQTAVRTRFSHCTLLVIAHRLDTVMDFDKIMVVDKGDIIEFGRPQNLLQNESSAFAKLVSQSNSQNKPNMDRQQSIIGLASLGIC